MLLASLVHLNLTVVIMIMYQAIKTEACTPQFPSLLVLPVHIARSKFHGRGDFSFEPFQSERKKTLDCTCGRVPSNPPSKFKFPWDVLITHSYSSSSASSPDKACRGTIINDRVILTTASCVFKLTMAEIMDEPWKPLLFPQRCYAQREQLKVWLTFGGLAGKQGMEVSDIYNNPLFLFGMAMYSKVDYDIALLTLKTPLNFENGMSLPVCLPTSPHNIPDSHLEGLESLLTRWYLTEPQNPFTVDEEATNFYSNIYPRMNCRINTENTWISDRFLCTLAPKLQHKRYIDVGSALLIKNGDQYTQVGVHSWTTYFPLLHKRKPVSLASNAIGFMEKIETYSKNVNAQWCNKDWNGLPAKMRNGEALNSPFKEDQNDPPWMTTTSETRNVLKSCKCGVVNSLSRARIQGGIDTLPYEYGWQVLILSSGGNKESRQLCGGSIINSRVVATAAHCVYLNIAIGTASPSNLVKPENLQIYMHRFKGPMERDDMSRVAKVEAVIPHPNFTTDKLIENDIALIVLQRPLCFKCLRGKVSPVCFPETNKPIQLEDRTDAKVIGWGRTKVLEKGSHAEKLQELTVSIISRTECLRILEANSVRFFVNQIRYDRKKLCAGTFSPSWNYTDPGQGDSGGPLFLPASEGSQTLVHVGIASMITMGPEAVKNKDARTVTFYTKSQEYANFVDYYSFLVGAVWCSA